MLSHAAAIRLSERLLGKPTGCIEYTGTIGEDGYGVFYADGGKYRAHRATWLIANGRIEDGLFVLHHCDNRRCCNLEHLYLGTHLENARDREIRGRSGGPIAANKRKTECIRGHPLAGKNLQIVNGARVCRTCSQTKAHAYYLRNKTLVNKRATDRRLRLQNSTQTQRG